MCYLCIQDPIDGNAEVQNPYTMNFETDVYVELRRNARTGILMCYLLPYIQNLYKNVIPDKVCEI